MQGSRYGLRSQLMETIFQIGVRTRLAIMELSSNEYHQLYQRSDAMRKAQNNPQDKNVRI